MLLTDEKLLLFLPAELRTLLEQNENSFQFPFTIFFSFNDRNSGSFLGNHPPQGQLRYGLSGQTVLFFLFQFRNSKIVQICPTLHPGELKSVEIKLGQIPASRTTTSGLASTGQCSTIHEKLITLDFFIHISTAFS